jgi:hypothetical protein
MIVPGSRHDGKLYDATSTRSIEAGSDFELCAFLNFRRSRECDLQDHQRQVRSVGLSGIRRPPQKLTTVFVYKLIGIVLQRRPLSLAARANSISAM